MWTKEKYAAHNKAWREAHKEERRLYMKNWASKNREYLRLKQEQFRRKNPNAFKEYYKRNLEKMRARSKAEYHAGKKEIDRKYKIWYEKNKDKMRKRALKWQKDNKAKSNSNCRRYVASKLNATPGWANKFFIDEIYDLAHLRTKITGIRWHVDHIVPLRSKRVCGLHVEHNLRVIPAKENLAKHNTTWPDMP